MSTQAIRPTTPPRPPSMQEIQAMMPGLKLYNPSDEWKQLNVHGRTDLWIPPDLNGQVEPHPATQEPVRCDGILDVKNRFLTQKDSSGKTISGQDAFSIISYLIHKDRYGEMGMVYLPGRSVEEDEGYKAYGREQYLKFQASVDDKVISRRREFVGNWKRNAAHQGQPVPPPTERENSAIERTQEREHQAAYAYQCEVEDCLGYATQEFQKFARHMWSAHKVQANRAKDGSVSLRNQAGDVVRIEGPVGASGGVSTPVTDEVTEEAPRAIAKAAKSLETRAKGKKGRA